MATNYKKRIPAVVALVFTLGFLALAETHLDLADNSFFTRIEYRLIDWKFRVRGQQPPGNEVIIVAEDEKTLNKLGSARTLRRETMADLIAKVSAGSPKAIGFDILYPEENKNPEDDQKLAAAMKAAGNVVLGVHLGQRGELDPVLTNASASIGFTNFPKDGEGRTRYQPLLIEYEGHLYPSLDLQLVKSFLGTISPIVDTTDSHIDQQLRIASQNITRNIPTDQSARLLVNFDGDQGIHQNIPMTDVLEGKVANQVFKDKIVLIGTTAVGLFDTVTTPFAPVLPGIELHANVIDSILHERYLYRDGFSKIVDIMTIILFGVVIGYLCQFDAYRILSYSALMFAGFLVLNVWAFIRLHLVLSIVYPGLSLVVTSGLLICYKYVTEERVKKRIKSAFHHYLAPHVIEQVMNNPEILKLGGEKRELTVLFSDIRGFTSFSEKMAPAEVVQFLNQYFDKMVSLIFKNKGTLDKLIGDSVMCFWGHPVDVKNHALRGVITALEMIKGVDDLRGVLVLPGGAKFEIGIGLNSGPMVVGNMGTQSRLSYTVMGDNVNLGSSLESLNKHYGTKIIISESTYRSVRDLVICRQLDTIQVQGKSHVVAIYEPMGLKRLEFERRKVDRRKAMTTGKKIKRTFIMLTYGERRQSDRRIGSDRIVATPEQEEIATMYEHALTLYNKGDFDGADMAFEHVLALSPGDGPSRLMRSRIAKYRTEHSGDAANFDPVFKFDEK